MPSPALGDPYVVHSNLRIWVLAYFEAKKIQKKKKFFYKRDIMQLFSADATMF